MVCERGYATKAQKVTKELSKRRTDRRALRSRAGSVDTMQSCEHLYGKRHPTWHGQYLEATRL